MPTELQRSARSILAHRPRPCEDVLDEVYRNYATSNPFVPLIRFVAHATMGAEALVGLGMGRTLREWMEGHRPRPYEAPRTGIPLPTNWTRALGQADCYGDWVGFFEAELVRSPFPDVLGQWLPRFVHDVGALLFHGLIRTAHAVRALDRQDTPARRGELARGLALWAVGVRRPAVDMVVSAGQDDPEGDPGGGGEENAENAAPILRFARAGAATLVVHPSVPNVHLVTGPMAYGMVAHHLGPEVHRRAAAAFDRTHADALRRFDRLRARAESEPLPTLDPEFLAWLSVQRDAHPIKLTEAALRAYEATEDELFLRAVGKARHLHGAQNLLGLRWAISRRVA
jgi:hypothetical protein